MNIALWIVQGLLGALFTLAGITKATQPKEKLSARMPWVNDYTATQVKLIGIAELLGGVGLILPWALDIVPGLTVLAALGLALVMILAAIYHLRKGEYAGIGINAVFLALALFVAVGRFAS